MNTQIKAPSIYRPAPVRLTPPAAYRPQRAETGLQPKRIQLKAAGSFPGEARPAPPAFRPPGATGVRPPGISARTTIQQSQKQRDIRAAKIYSGQQGGFWYPSGSSGGSDKAFHELGITAHELHSGPGSIAKTKENIEAYWDDHPTITRSQLAARFYLKTTDLDDLGVRQ